MKKLTDYGDIQNIFTPSGNTLEILPTCNVPIDTLMQENWGLLYPYGNFRSVRSVETLVTGEHAGLFIKSPERIFTNKSKILSQGTVWWGGRRSGESSVRINHPLVEEQTVWKALFLLELTFHDIPAERPQAIVTYPTGHKELIVKTIPLRDWNRNISTRGRSEQELKNDILKLGFLPEDYGAHNCLTDQAGILRIIDVNRWSWPPYTDSFRNHLLQLVRSRIAESL